MIKVLLVDDEQFIRQGMRHLVNWEKYGCQIVAEAENGMDAIRILEESDIDLAFVDIRMPGMTGMELISYARRNLYQQIRFVILTGYAEFQYARRALQMDVVDYMLKPVQEEELIAVLNKVNQDYCHQQQEQRENYDFHVACVLTGKYSEKNLRQIRRYISEEGLEMYVSFEFDKNHKEFAALGRSGRIEQQKGLVQYLKGLVGDFAYHVVPMIETEEESFGAGMILARALYEEEYDSEEEYLEHLQKRVAQHFSCPIQVYAGQKAESFEQMPQSFFSIRVARCLHGLAQEESQVRNYEDFRHRKSSLGINESDVDKLLEAVKNNRVSDIEAVAEQIFAQIRNSDMNMEMVNASIYHILYRLMEMVQEFDDETNQQEILEYIGKESFNKMVLAGSTEEITGFFSDYAGYLAQVRTQESRRILDRVDAYVRQNYMQKMSLKSLGELFYVNNVYLGQLYKKKYGIAFRDYLNNLRMEKARELLVNTNMRIYAIAEEVGFGKAEYFINKFVQMYNMTPNQYRIRNRRAESEGIDEE